MLVVDWAVVARITVNDFLAMSELAPTQAQRFPLQPICDPGSFDDGTARSAIVDLGGPCIGREPALPQLSLHRGA